MSQAVETEKPEVEEFQPVVADEPIDEPEYRDGYGEFHYKQIPPLAPFSMVLGVCSLFALGFLFAIPIAILGVVVGAIAVRKISASEGELGGMKLAAVGFGLSVFLLVTSSAKHAYVIATEVPEGFTKIHFVQSISQYAIGQRQGQMVVPPPVQELVGQKVFLKGYMWQTEHKEGLTEFLLVKDNQVCCFGPGQIKPQDMVLVQMQGGKTMDLTIDMVSVAGTFELVRTRPNFPGAEQMQPIVYRLVAESAERSKTSF